MAGRCPPPGAIPKNCATYMLTIAHSRQRNAICAAAVKDRCHRYADGGQIASAQDSSWCQRKRRQRRCVSLCRCGHEYVVYTVICASIGRTFEDAYHLHSESNQITGDHRRRLARSAEEKMTTESKSRLSCASAPVKVITSVIRDVMDLLVPMQTMTSLEGC